MSEKYVTRGSDVEVTEMDWGSLRWYTSKGQGNSEDLTTGLCVLKPGQGNPPHFHPNCEEVLHVLSGRIMHAVDDDEVELGEGDTICLPVNQPHSARNIGETEACLFICFSSADRKAVPVEDAAEE